MLVAVIVVCEVAFWVLLLAGLATRYLLHRPRAGLALMAAAPVVDLVLLAASVVDLRRGGTAGTPHALAAVYLGVSVGFGHRMVRWADEHFAHRFAGGPAPSRPPTGGVARARHELRAWRRHLVAYAVGVALMTVATLVIGDASRTRVLADATRLWTIVLLIDLVWGQSYRLRLPGSAARGGERGRPEVGEHPGRDRADHVQHGQG